MKTKRLRITHPLGYSIVKNGTGKNTVWLVVDLDCANLRQPPIYGIYASYLEAYDVVRQLEHDPTLEEE